MSALVECLDRPDGCRVVPGLPQEQYVFTLWCAIAGGLVAGFVNKIEPQGALPGAGLGNSRGLERGAYSCCLLLEPIVVQSQDITAVSQPPAAMLCMQSCVLCAALFIGSCAAFTLLLLPAAAAAGIVKRKWVWLLLFSPLWGSLFINFGLGPIVSRTSDLAPIAGNTLGFLAAAAAPGLLQRLWDGEQPPVKDS
jgi:hypothetical protein